MAARGAEPKLGEMAPEAKHGAESRRHQGMTDTLNRVGEGALDFAEDHHAEKEQAQTDPEADGPLDQIHPADTKKGQAEGLDNGDHGIPDEHVLPFLGHGR